MHEHAEPVWRQLYLDPGAQPQPWQITCQPYPTRWLNHHRKEKWAARSRLRRVARQLAKQPTTSQEKYRMAIWAEYTEYEAAYIVRLAKAQQVKNK